ncbi:MAG: class I SAM-dependent methyltransferase [Acidobacteria bacterium]|nr:class I SAM-dependent methyltransferase [Acidobacteriota bacterium]
MTTVSQCLLCHEPTQMVELCHVSFGSIVRCQQCALVRVSPFRSSEQLATLHASLEYFQHPYFEARRDLAREESVAKQRALLSTLIDGSSLKKIRLLDIGCDTGALLVVARDEFGMDVMGVEVSREASTVAQQQNGLNVVNDFNELRGLRGTFDVITLVDVIEHVANPAALLEEVSQLLRAGGKVYIITPNHDALINKLGLILHRVLGTRARSLIEKLYIPYHEFYFTEATLARLVKQSGLQIERQTMKEFPLNEFGHGLILKLGLVPIFAAQRLTRRQTLQELVAVK